jgi:C-terminal processing protease CtpA/Prc
MSLRSEDTGYGVTWSVNSLTAPRTWRVAIVEPGSPAAAAGLQRGDMLATIDGIDFINTSDRTQIDRMNAGLYPATAGEAHTYTVQRNGATVTAALTSAVVTTTPVKNVKVLDTPTGKVGYLSFEDHNAIAEQQLINAFASLKNQGVTDLVLDMRYNGGGYLYIASELAYMVAGPSTAGKTFEQLIYNDKTKPDAPTPFFSTAYGFTAPAGSPLPYLGLKHVTVLTSSDTCSASESVINGLRGVDVQVDLIGGATCGKPYGFLPEANCGTTYFSIQFRGVNAKGFGDYADGFTPTCNVADDMAHDLGDPAEGVLAAALSYRTSKACPAATAATVTSVPTRLARSPLKKIAIYPMSTRMRAR